MSTFLIFITNLLFFNASASLESNYQFSSKPKKIVSIAQEFYKVDYYKEQALLWKDLIDQNQSNADAWLNYYRACRFVNMLDASSSYELNEIYNELSNHIKGSYEYHYLSFVNGGADPSLFHHIEKAYEIDPDRSDVYSLMINRAAIKQDLEALKKFNSKWMSTGEISQGVLAWNYNSLMSLEPNAILLSHGDNDTYPAWMLQQVQEVRPDVEVINLNLLRIKEYCDAIFTKCNIPIYKDGVNETITWEDDFTPLANHIIQHSVRPLFFSLTIPKSIRDNYSDQLYTVGLSFKYSAEAFDNVRVLMDNYENKFMTDYMLVGFHNDKSVSVLNTMNMSYLPAFLTLYREYNKQGKVNKAEKIAKLSTNIAKAGGQLQSVLNIIESSKTLKPITESYMDIKAIDKSMKKVAPGLYASSLETTNENYEQFLMDLLRNKEFDLLDQCKINKTDWMALLPEKFRYLKMHEVYHNGYPDDPKAPIQNISHQAAELYCQWLTRVYNGYGKKKTFEKVIFRLPTEEEWVNAAQAGRDLSPYPWGGYYYTNAKGCYLSNFYSSDEPLCIDCENEYPDNDGAFFIVRTGTYFPNDFGLYNLSGNVAEMVQQKGIAKGGSWEDIPKECTIQAIKEVVGPSPAVGFRVFMEIVNN